MEEGEEGEEGSRGLSAPCRWASPECFSWCGCAWRVNESSMKSYSQMKRSALPVRSPLTREKGQQNQESRQPAQRDKSTKSVQETVINKTVSNQSSKGVNIIQGKTCRIGGFSVFHFFTFDIWVFQNGKCEKKLRRRQKRRRGGNYGNNYNYLI